MKSFLSCCGLFKAKKGQVNKKGWQSFDNDNTESSKKIYGKGKKKEENKIETYSSTFGDSNSYGGNTITSTTSYGYGTKD